MTTKYNAELQHLREELSATRLDRGKPGAVASSADTPLQTTMQSTTTPALGDSIHSAFLPVDAEVEAEGSSGVPDLQDDHNVDGRSAAASIRQLSEHIHRLSREREILIERSVSERDAHATLARDNIRIKEAAAAEIGRLRGEVKSLRSSLQAAQTTIDRLKRGNEVAQSKSSSLTDYVEGVKSELESFAELKSSVYPLQLQVEQLRVDNARLVRLLSSVPKFQEFLIYIRDSGGAVYIPQSAQVSAEWLNRDPLTHYWIAPPSPPPSPQLQHRLISLLFRSLHSRVCGSVNALRELDNSSHVS